MPHVSSVALHPKRILVNNAYGQIRVALLEGTKLDDLEIEPANFDQKVDSICNGEILSVEPSLEAAFVNYGSKRNGFLPLKEVAPEYYTESARKKSNPNIADVVFVGQKVLVQIIKAERGSKEQGIQKGAALSTYLTLAGQYLVLMPNNPKAGGVSRRIDGPDREALQQLLTQLTVPEGMGVIIRTAGIGRSLEELTWDLNTLVELWTSIKAASQTYGAPYLIHQDTDIVIRTLRDQFKSNVEEVYIDDPAIFEKARQYVEKMQPALVSRVKLYTDLVPLFSQFQIEWQIESLFQRRIRLPSGGEIVIDRTEALTTVDVNSAQSTRGEHIEQTAFHTNLEAAEEIARQLRIRDLGGLFVIDFIDMVSKQNRKDVETALQQACARDRAYTKIGFISPFGLLEMSRQRVTTPLMDSQVACKRCHGQGLIPSIHALAIAIIHLVQERSLKEKVTQVQVQAPIALATYLLNEQRDVIEQIQTKHSIQVIVIPNPYLEMPDYLIETRSSAKGDPKSGLSYDLLSVPAISYIPETVKHAQRREQPIVKDALPLVAAPVQSQSRVRRWIQKLLSIFKHPPSPSGSLPPASRRNQKPSFPREGRKPQGNQGPTGRNGSHSSSGRSGDRRRREGGGSSGQAPQNHSRPTQQPVRPQQQPARPRPPEAISQPVINRPTPPKSVPTEVSKEQKAVAPEGLIMVETNVQKEKE